MRHVDNKYIRENANLLGQRRNGSAVVPGAILGQLCFTTMIDDMDAQLPVFKYVVDTTMFEILNIYNAATKIRYGGEHAASK